MLEHVRVKEYDHTHPKSPLMVYVRGTMIGSIPKSMQSEDIYYLLDSMYKKGLEDGKKDRSAEIKELLS